MEKFGPQPDPLTTAPPSPLGAKAHSYMYIFADTSVRARLGVREIQIVSSV